MQRSVPKKNEDKENCDSKVGKDENPFLSPAPWTPITKKNQTEKKGILTTPNHNNVPTKEKNHYVKNTPTKMSTKITDELSAAVISPERR
ncbi:maternal embryonic leucine zipper kinase-like [Bombina bombina]|uniref:maternal embryonic leucine zipper kinase-like n=1 Tax=Bombina bombina TaxID=8345 RepID=UPI00235AC2B9|nr:maternal embryonic leucine zipper kinase-like [Bombina bombina]